MLSKGWRVDMINQCDGCRCGWEIDANSFSGKLHRDPEGRNHISCTAHLYAQEDIDVVKRLTAKGVKWAEAQEVMPPTPKQFEGFITWEMENGSIVTFK